MASVTEKSNGSFKIRVYMGEGPDGRKIYRCTTYTPKATTPGKRLKEAEQFADDYEKQLRTGQHLSGEDLKLNDFVKIWFRDYAPEKLTLREIEYYKQILNREFLPSLGNCKIAAVNPMQLQSVVSGMKKRGLQPGTIRRYFNCISSVMSSAYKANVIRENPCGRITFPKIERDPTKIQYFDKHQAVEFLNALDRPLKVRYPEKIRKNGRVIPAHVEEITISTQFRALFTLAIFTGARRGELLALTWNDIDLDNCVISITKNTASTKDAGQYLKEPKTKAGVRSFSVPVNCITRLMEWKTEQMELCRQLGTYWKGKPCSRYDDNFVFIQDDGRQMDLHTPTHKFREILNYYNASVSDPDKKLPVIKFHDLRHTSASIMIASGYVDIETIARRLGHSDVSMTLNRYGHALPSQDEKAAFALASMLSLDDDKPQGSPGVIVQEDSTELSADMLA